MHCNFCDRSFTSKEIQRDEAGDYRCPNCDAPLSLDSSLTRRNILELLKELVQSAGIRDRDSAIVAIDQEQLLKNIEAKLEAES